MYKHSFFIILLVVCWGAISVQAQQLTTRISANTIAQGDLLKVWYEVENTAMNEFREPQFLDWKVIEGPQLESLIEHTGGQSRSRQSYVFYLEPLHTGSLVVPSAMAQLPGGWTSSKAVIVTVVKGSGKTADPQVPQSTPPGSVQTPDFNGYDALVLRDGEDPKTKIASNLFVQVNASKQAVYDGEPVVVTYQLYCRVDLEARLVKRPSFTGCTAIDLPTPPEGSYTLEVKNGKTFKVYEIRKVQLYPLQDGQIALEPLEIDATVRFTRIPGSLSALENFNAYDPANQLRFPYLIKSERKTIQVKPIPGGRVVAVGNFSIRAEVADSSLSLNEPTSIKIIVEGKGRWSLLNTPSPDWPAALQVFSAKMEEIIDSTAIPVSGRRVYTYPVAATEAGEIIIPAVEMPWFDPGSEQFGSSQTQPIVLHISNTPFALAADNGDGMVSTASKTRWPVTYLLLALAAILVMAWLYFRRQSQKRWEKLPKDQYHPAQPVGENVPVWSVNNPSATTTLPTQASTAKLREQKADETGGNSPDNAKLFFQQALHRVEQAMVWHRQRGLYHEALEEEVKLYRERCHAFLYGPPNAIINKEEESTMLESLLSKISVSS